MQQPLEIDFWRWIMSSIVYRNQFVEMISKITHMLKSFLQNYKSAKNST
jgi:hypothetical protein